METQIIRVGPGQAALLARVAEDVFDEPIDAALLADYLAAPGHLMVVAVTDGEVVGQARGMVHRHPDRDRELYIDNLGVTPPRQREHIATRLLDALVAWGQELGCEEGWVGTETDNAPARALYAGRGAEAESFVMYAYEFEETPAPSALRASGPPPEGEDL